MTSPIPPLRAAATASLLLLLLLNGCGNDNPTGPPFEHTPPIDGTIYYLQKVEQKTDSVDADTTLYSLRVKLVPTPRYGDAYRFSEVQAGGQDFATLQYLESGDIRRIIFDTLDADYLLPFGGGGPHDDTIALEHYNATHATRYVGEEEIMFDGRSYTARVVTDRFVEKVGGHSSWFGVGGLRTSYYIPELAYPVIERVEIGPDSDEGNLSEIYSVTTFTVTRIIK